MAISAQLHQWNTMPVDWPLPTAERKRIVGEHVMISRFVLQAGTIVPMHSHANEQMSCVVSGLLRFELEATDHEPQREVRVGPGQVLHLPPFVRHGVVVEELTEVLDIFSPPSATTGIDQRE